MRLNELVVLMRCLENAFESERPSESDKTVVREIMRRIFSRSDKADGGTS
jgi:hypothetical protein